MTAKRPYPLAAERTAEVVALRERVEVLEGHRDLWRRFAFQLADRVRAGDLEGAQNQVRDFLEEGQVLPHKSPANLRNDSERNER